MSASPRDLINDLECAFAQGTPHTRRAALWHATDILLIGQYSEDQIWLFGEIIDRLAAELELQARAKLASLLSQSNNAPIQTIKKLAHDDSIAVAGPVLSNTMRLDENELIEVARTKSQQHLFAITQRKSLPEAVTDVLVTRGDQHVVHAVVKNEGAVFSDISFWHLVRRSENDSILAEYVGVRKDIPRHQFLHLIARASEEVKQRLASVVPAAMNEIEHIIADAAGVVNAKFGPASKQYFAAKRLVMELHQAGRLDENKLYTFAKAKKLEETTVAFSLLCAVPSHIAERVLIENTPEMVLILGKSAALSWKTVQSLLVMRAGENGVAQHDMDAASEKFCRLTTTTAKAVLQFYQERRKSTA
jgi:uncharacterized protein (DUF2336 family)